LYDDGHAGLIRMEIDSDFLLLIMSFANYCDSIVLYFANEPNNQPIKFINHEALISIATSRLICYNNKAVRQSVNDRSDDDVAYKYQLIGLFFIPCT